MNTPNQPDQVSPSAQSGQSKLTATALRMSERQRFQQRLARTIAAATDWNAALDSVGKVLGEACGTQFVCAVRSGRTPGETTIEGLTAPIENINDELRQRLGLFGLSACRSMSTQVQSLQNTSESTSVVTVPLRQSATHFEALQLLREFESDSHQDRVISLVELAGGSLREWSSDSLSKSLQSRLDITTTLVDLLARLDASPNIEDAAQVLVNCLSEHFDQQTVVLALNENEQEGVKFVARSQSAHAADPTEEWIVSLESALQESLIRASLSIEPPFDPNERHSLLAHRGFLKTDRSECIISSPLRNENGKTLGAWAVIFDQMPDPNTDVVPFFRAAETSVASSFDLVQRAQPGGFTKLLDRFSIARSNWKTKLALSAAIVTTCLMLLPLDYNVKCDCEVQPIQRRFVAAPFDGPLEKSMVEPGDLVTQDQLLARLDGREIRWELAGVQAEKNRAAKERDGYRARQDFGQAQIAEYDMNRHDVRRKLLENRSHNLEIRSPVDGIVIEGDWKKSEGIPLSMGQSMFEIAPLDKMLVEVGIPEEDINYVKVGQTLTVSLDAIPGRTWTGEVEQIHPRSEIREQAHVYICEMSIDNANGLLRPGMQGRAKIATVMRPLGWNLLHKPWNSFVMWLRYSI